MKEMTLVLLQFKNNNIFETVNFIEVSHKQHPGEVTLRGHLTHTPVDEL